MIGKNFVKGRWTDGSGEAFVSIDPATDEVLWQGNSTSKEQVNKAIQAASFALPQWSELTVDERLKYLELYSEELKQQRSQISKTISRETGKPLWESDTEVAAMINKLSISVEAYHNRYPALEEQSGSGRLITRHRPHGVLAILGPFNFPGHLPNGHIIPALLAGNTVVFKPSESTPLVAQILFECWEKAQLPDGVINLIQGAKETGESLTTHADINGVIFTGSFTTGQKIASAFNEYPEKILALEMGGNNPLVVHQIKNTQAAVYNTIQSAYVTSGQRCTCARRLIVVKGQEEEQFVHALMNTITKIKIGPFSDHPEPFMGPVISKDAANRIISSYEGLIALGAKPLVPMQRIHATLPFLSPALLDVTALDKQIDEEIFGPLLQLMWVNSFEAAIMEANKTSYGLAAGLLSDSEVYYQQFLLRVRAGLINWNRPLTGASSRAPFGGIKRSGNHRASAYYAADYCAYPVASIEENVLKLPDTLSPGIVL